MEHAAERASQTAGRAAANIKSIGATEQAISARIGAASSAIRTAGGVITAIIATESIRALADAIGDRIHESVRMETAGMTPAEIEQAKLRAAELSREFPT